MPTKDIRNINGLWAFWYFLSVMLKAPVIVKQFKKMHGCTLSIHSLNCQGLCGIDQN